MEKEIKNILNDGINSDNLLSVLNKVEKDTPEYKIFNPIKKVLKINASNNDEEIKKFKKMIAFSIRDSKNLKYVFKKYEKEGILEYLYIDAEYYVYTFKNIAKLFWGEKNRIPKKFLRYPTIINYLKMNTIPNVIIKDNDDTLIKEFKSIDLKHRINDIKNVQNEFKEYLDKQIHYNGDYQEIDCSKSDVYNLYYKLKLGKKLGSGSIGNIYYGLHLSQNDSNNQFVVKFYDKAVYNESQLKHITKSIEIHKNLTKLITDGVCPNFVAVYTSFNCVDNFPIQIQERSGIDLYKLIIKEKQYESHIPIVMLQTFIALYAMHKLGYAHCDLKLENIMSVEISNKYFVYKNLVPNNDIIIPNCKLLCQINDFDFTRNIKNRKSVDKETVFYNPSSYFRYKRALSKELKKKYDKYDVDSQLKELNNVEYVDLLSLVLFIGKNDFDFFDDKFISKYLKDISKKNIILQYILSKCENDKLIKIKNESKVKYPSDTIFIDFEKIKALKNL